MVFLHDTGDLLLVLLGTGAVHRTQRSVVVGILRTLRHQLVHRRVAVAVVVLQYQVRAHVARTEERVVQCATLLDLQAHVHVLWSRALREMAGICIHLLQDQVVSVVQLYSGASSSMVLRSSRAGCRHLDLLATGRSLGSLPLLLLQLELSLYAAQVVELLLLYASLLLLTLRREDALIVVDHLHFVLILLRYACGNGHVIWR